MPGFLTHRNGDEVRDMQACGEAEFTGKTIPAQVPHRARPSLATSPFLAPTTHSTSTKPGGMSKHLTRTPSAS